MFNQFVIVGMDTLFVGATTGVLIITNHRAFTHNTTFNRCDIFSVFCHKARDLKFFWEAFRCIVWHFMFNHFVNVSLNRSIFRAFRTSRELIVVTNHRRCRYEPRFSILDFSAFFIHVTRYVEYWNIHLRCIIWHFRFNQFVDMGLHITTIVGISCTSELIVFNGVRCINKTLFGCFDVHSIFRLILSHFQLRNFNRRCITRN